MTKKKTSTNSNLRKAAKNKNDEFYTRLTDIENELSHYKEHFKNKIVYCNCDDPYRSNFVKYFIDNFNELGIDRLYATHYTPDEGLSCKNDENPNFMLEYDGSYKYSVLLGDGDFRSDECVDILKRCDVVVTNPPFSLFREFVDLIMSHKKDFLVIGNQNAITYKEFFPLLKDDIVRLGVCSVKEFIVRDKDLHKLSKSIYWCDLENEYKARFGNISWFTTLHHDVPTKPLKFTKTYNEKDYPKYDNYNAINVDKIKEIPCDYAGLMGVPITFMNKYDPKQFEIIGHMVTTKKSECNFGYPYINGKKKYARVIIRNRKPQLD